MPSRDIIDGLAGTIDFYLWNGIACARKWPHYPPRKPFEAEASNQADFAYINKLAPTLSPLIIENAKLMAAGTKLTWKDLIVMGYMSGIPYNEP